MSRLLAHLVLAIVTLATSGIALARVAAGDCPPTTRAGGFGQADRRAAVFERPVKVCTTQEERDRVRQMFEKAGVEAKVDLDPVASVNGYRTLVLALGSTGGGRGAVFVADRELTRTRAFIAQAKKEKVPIIVWLMRGDDTKRSRVAVAAADYVLISTRDWSTLHPIVGDLQVPVETFDDPEVAARILSRLFAVTR